MFCKGKWAAWLGMALWSLAALALILAWVAVLKRDLVFGLEPLAWYWNALVLGVLSLPCKSRPCVCSAEEKKEM